MSSATTPAQPRVKGGLKTLASAMNVDVLRDVLTPLLRESYGGKATIENIELEVLRSRSKRCVLRYLVIASDGRNGADVHWRVIGKVFRPKEGEIVFEYMQKLWDSGFARGAGDGISMPEPLRFDSSLCLLLQEEVPGLPIKTLMLQNPEEADIRKLARVLVKLHRCGLILGKTVTVRDHLLRCHPKHQVLSYACPDLAPMVEYLVERAFEIETEFGDYQPMLLHGDFHLGQTHMENGSAWLIDFDALCYGDPAADLGNVLVFMKGKARRNPAIHKMTEAFLDEYFNLMDPKIADRVPLYEALTHLRRACKSLRLQREGWQERAQRMLEQGMAIIKQYESH